MYAHQQRDLLTLRRRAHLSGKRQVTIELSQAIDRQRGVQRLKLLPDFVGRKLQGAFEICQAVTLHDALALDEQAVNRLPPGHAQLTIAQSHRTALRGVSQTGGDARALQGQGPRVGVAAQSKIASQTCAAGHHLTAARQVQGIAVAAKGNLTAEAFEAGGHSRHREAGIDILERQRELWHVPRHAADRHLPLTAQLEALQIQGCIEADGAGLLWRCHPGHDLVQRIFGFFGSICLQFAQSRQLCGDQLQAIGHHLGLEPDALTGVQALE